MLNKITNNHPQLPAIFLLVIVFLLLGLAFRLRSAAFPATPTPVGQVVPATPLLPPTLTPSSSPTTTNTPRPTWTLAPTSTPTQTGTPTHTAAPTLLPTLTPARPLQYNDLYRMYTWNPERANHLIRLMQDYPNARVPRETERLTPAYDRAFVYAAFAQREALLRFPDEPQSDSWRWGLAYNLTRLNDPEAGKEYLALLEAALNSETITIESLPGWFSEHEYRLDLQTTSITPPQGSANAWIVEIKTAGGGIYLWMLESRQNYRGQVLVSRFNYAGQIQPSYSLGDLTNDGYEELVISYSPPTGDYFFTPPQVFNLSRPSAQELSFTPDLPFDFGMDYVNEWIVAQTSGGDRYLQFVGSIYPACPIRVTRSYTWNGEQLSTTETNYNIQPYPELLGHCERVITHAKNVWEPEVTARLTRNLLPDWPPAANPDGKPYPAETRDQWQLQAGVYTALAGEYEEAVEILSDLISMPTVPSNAWILQAESFLEAYQSEDDLYIACAKIEACDMQLALERLARSIPTDDYRNAPAYLNRLGVDLRGSGIFDFENDGQPERWLLVRHRPTQKLEFWILVQAPGSARALFVELADSSEPALRFHEPVSDPPVVQTQMQQGFVLARVPASQEPYLFHLTVEFTPTTFTKDALENAVLSLFAGVNPGQVARDLEEVKSSGRFNCLNYRICDRFYYTLGLAYELSGETQNAKDTYIDLWWNERASQYANMARLKLEQLPFKTSTPTRTPTGDPNATATPFRTSTSTPTHDPNATATATITPSLTPTVEGPYP
jgi:hypothetical protein